MSNKKIKCNCVFQKPGTIPAIIGTLTKHQQHCALERRAQYVASMERMNREHIRPGGQQEDFTMVDKVKHFEIERKYPKYLGKPRN